MKRFFSKVAERIGKLDTESLRDQFSKLSDELRFFESIFAALREGVLVVDPCGEITYANRAAEELLSFSFDAKAGMPVAQLVPDLDWHNLLAPDDGWSRRTVREYELLYPERRILELDATPSEKGSVILVRDVTLQRAREADALESGRTDAVRELAAGVAHEIGNPLNALSLNLQLLARSFRREPDPTRRAQLLADVETAQREVKRIVEINRGFLDALRPIRPNLVPGTPADALSDTLAALKNQIEDRRIHVSVDLPPALPPVMIDRAQMEQVFFNLVKNALEAMKDGASLFIELSSDDHDVSIAFRDEGGGMDEETLSRLFDSFHTTKGRKGTGLGLLLSRRIVRAHGGEIDVESKAGTGTKFTVRLPRLEKRIRRLT